MTINPDLWRGRRVFLTGHSGFVGGWLVHLLVGMGAHVAGYALAPPGEPNLHDLTGVAGLVDGGFGDIRDGAALASALAAAEPDVVLHLAAQPLVRRAFAEPVDTFATNVMGTVHLLEAIRLCPAVQAAVVVTTDKVYDNREWAWPYRETDALGGREPYGVSKACCEMAVDAYRKSYFESARRLPVATVRAGNVIGGGDWAEDRLVPDAIRAFTGGRPLVLRNPMAVRPWQHVLEMAAGCLTIAERLIAADADAANAFAKGWNFGPRTEDARPVSWVADRLALHWGDGARWEPEDGARPYEARLLMLDSTLAHGELGWRPRWTLDTALARTVEWYRARHRGEDMRAVTRRQIEEFMDDQ
ncbi:CDP-glucose 4,6-dehydratase [Azospirillum halopraeferens]|uniref:CDP-glucose 4,6-dehydratase n=1 Tax=Azospirillum halopraeferens TaxID=34010 RepID=UPI000413C480|nr:CDP-glucose 4,6-dehydratase [Azospirillum halopraeferens]